MRQLGWNFVDDLERTPDIGPAPAVHAQLVTLMAQSLLAVLDPAEEETLTGDDDDRQQNKP